MYNYRFSPVKNGAPFISLNEIETIKENILKKFYGEKYYQERYIDIYALAEFEFDLEYAYLSNNQCYFGMMIFSDETEVITLKELYPINGGYRLQYLKDRANTMLIDKTLCEDSYENLIRFTLAHECGHGLFHQEYFYKDKNQITFLEESAGIVACRKKDIMSAGVKSWTNLDIIEWQANTFSSCILMNRKSIHYFLEELGGANKWISSDYYIQDFIDKMSERFRVSKQAACVRLKVLNYI